MILPQGQFEKLLVSDSEEKEKILSTLFGTGRWAYASSSETRPRLWRNVNKNTKHAPETVRKSLKTRRETSKRLSVKTLISRSLKDGKRLSRGLNRG